MATPGGGGTTGAGTKGNQKKRSRPTITTNATSNDDDKGNHTTAEKIGWNWLMVPWRSVEEWNAVGTALCSVLRLGTEHEEPEEDAWGTSRTFNSLSMTIPQALRQVEYWKRKTQGLPHGVEATAALAQVLYEHNIIRTSLAGGDGGDTNSTVFQYAYAAAIVRTVNGLVDPLQQSRTVANSIAILADRLGIPTWVVDVRHAATHNALPSVSVLQLTATTLLEYLHTAYWQPWQQLCQTYQTQIFQRIEAYETFVSMDHASLPIAAAGLVHDDAAITTDTDEEDYLPISMTKNEKEEEQDEEDSSRGSTTHQGSRLGTNLNMFALLMDPPKTSKPKKKATTKAGGTITVETKRSSKKKNTKKPKTIDPPRQNPIGINNRSSNKKTNTPMNATTLAQAITSSRPRPILWQVFVMHLVWGKDFHQRGGGGALVQVDPTTTTASATTRSHHSYGPLLVTVACKTPGLCEALVMHLTDFVLMSTKEGSTVMNNQGPDNDSQPQQYAKNALNWIHYLVSQSFVLAVEQKRRDANSLMESEPSSRSPPDQMATSPTMLPYAIPVHAFMARCRTAMNCTSSTTSWRHELLHQLYDIFCQVALNGNSRFGEMEAPHLSSSFVHDDRIKHQVSITTTTDATKNSSLSTMQAIMSLEEMEAMLSQKQKTSAVAEHALLNIDGPSRDNAGSACQKREDVPIVVPWTPCEHWEPCPIGAIPGYPL